MQLSYDSFPNPAFAGLIADPSFVKNIRSYAALKAVGFGKVIVAVLANDGTPYCKEFERNLTIETLSGNLVTGNTVNANVNGTPISPVAFTTDNATTMALLAAAIEDASEDVLSVAVTSANVLTITKNPLTKGAVKVTGFVVTGGASQATVVETFNSNEHIVGISAQANNQPNVIGGPATYQAGDMVNVLTIGSIWGVVAGTVTPEASPAYAYADDDLTGVLTSNVGSAGGGVGVQIAGSVFRTITQADNLAEISISIP